MKKKLFSFFSVILLGLFLVACGKTFEVKFNVDGGEPQIEAKMVKKGQKVTKPDDPTKAGYTFLYWKEYTATEAWDFEKDVVEKDMTLYAFWEVDNEVVVTFEGEGVSLQPVTLEKGKKLTVDNPVRSGYVFVNWKVKGTNNVWNLNNPVNESMTLVAVWEEDNNVRVSFTGDGVSIPTRLIAKGSTVEKPEDPFNEGFVFIGWFEEGSTEEFDFETVLTKDLVLEAKYRAPEVEDAVAFIGDEHYFSIGLALAAAKENDIILIAAGTHIQNLEITVDNLTIKPKADAKVILKSKITLGSQLEGLTIEGLEFTDEAQIHAPDGLDNFVFKNNKVYDSKIVPTGYSPNNRIDVNAFIRIYKLEGVDITGNVTIENNEFIDMMSDIISIDRTKANKIINIKNNLFHNYPLSAIRFDGGYNNGTYNIIGNTFKHDVKAGAESAIVFRCYAPSEGNTQIINIKENEFYNVGSEELDYDPDTGYPGSGVIVFSTFNDNDTEVFINDNLFKDVTRAIHFRNAGSTADLSADFRGNIFENVEGYYLYQVRPRNYPAPEANFQNNLFKDADGKVITDLTVIGELIVNNNRYDEIRYSEVDEFVDVVFEGEGITIEPLELLLGNKVVVTKPTREGYQFVNWVIKGTETVWDLNDPVLEDLTLVAVWEETDDPDVEAYIGEVSYNDLEDAIDAIVEDDTLLIVAGTYELDFEIKANNVTIKPYKDGKVILKSVITLDSNLSGLTIEGLEFTEGAYIHAADGVDEFVFKNNKVYDSTLEPTAFGPNNRVDVNAFIRFYKLAGSNITGNVTIENNEFVNMSSDIISIDRTTLDKEINIKNNLFHNYPNTAVRFDGGYNNGTYNIEENIFKHDTKGGANSAILFRAFAPEEGNLQIINIKNNQFINVGNDSMDLNPETGHPGSGVILFSVFNDKLTEVYINGNYFKDVTRAIHFRNAGVEKDLSADLSENTFEDVEEYYLYQARPKTYPAPEANFQNNIYIENGEVLTDLAVIGQKIINNENFDEVVEPNVLVNGKPYETLEDALNAVEENGIIYVNAGTYSDEVVITKDNVKLVGPNKGVKADKLSENRKTEAEFTGRIVISGTTGVVIDGIKLSGKAQIYSTDGVKDVLIQNVLAESIGVDGAGGVIFFASAADSILNENITIKDNSIWSMNNRESAPRLIRINNPKNLYIEANYLYSSFDTIRLESQNNAGLGVGNGVRGELLIKNNVFEDSGQYPIWIGAVQSATINIVDNVIGVLEDSDGVYGYVYLVVAQNQETKTTINVLNNDFPYAVYDWHELRFNSNGVAADKLEINVNENIFHQAPGEWGGNNPERYYIIADHFATPASDFTIDGTNNYFLFDEALLLESSFLNTTYEPYETEIDND